MVVVVPVVAVVVVAAVVVMVVVVEGALPTPFPSHPSMPPVQRLGVRVVSPSPWLTLLGV